MAVLSAVLQKGANKIKEINSAGDLERRKRDTIGSCAFVFVYDTPEHREKLLQMNM